MRLFLRIESKANEDKEKKAMREKLKRDSEKIEDEPAEHANGEKKTTTEEIVEVWNKTDESTKESSKVVDELIEEEKKEGETKAKI